MAIFNIRPPMHAGDLEIAEIVPYPELCIARYRDIVVHRIRRPADADHEEFRIVAGVNRMNLDPLFVLGNVDAHLIREVVGLFLAMRLNMNGCGDFHFSPAVRVDAHISELVLQAERLVCTKRQGFRKFPVGSVLSGSLAQQRQRRQATREKDNSEFARTSWPGLAIHGLVSNISRSVSCFSWYIARS